MRSCFALQIALACVFAGVVAEGSFHVDGMRVVPFDQVRVIAIHRTHQIGKRLNQRRGKTPAEARGFLSEFDAQVRKRGAEAAGRFNVDRP